MSGVHGKMLSDIIRRVIRPRFNKVASNAPSEPSALKASSEKHTIK